MALALAFGYPELQHALARLGPRTIKAPSLRCAAFAAMRSLLVHDTLDTKYARETLRTFSEETCTQPSILRCSILVESVLLSLSGWRSVQETIRKTGLPHARDARTIDPSAEGGVQQGVESLGQAVQREPGRHRAGRR